MTDMVFRFNTADAFAAAFPCADEPRPPSWRCELVFGTEDAPRSLWVTVLGPQEVAPPYTEVYDETTDTWSREYAYDPTGVIEPGVWCTVTADAFDADLWASAAGFRRSGGPPACCPCHLAGGGAVLSPAWLHTLAG